jgi:hypothetical protein
MCRRLARCISTPCALGQPAPHQPSAHATTRRRPVRRGIALLVLLALPLDSAAGQSLKPNGRVLVLGTGYNTITGEIRSRCIEPEPGSVVPSMANVGATDFFLDIAERRQEIRQSSNLRVEASVGLGPFASDAEYNHLSQGEYSSFDNYFYTAVVVELQPEGSTQWRLTKKGKDYKKNGAVAFAEECGNAFVDAIIRGGELRTTFRIRDENHSQKTATAANLEMSLGAYASGKVSWEQTLQSVTSNKRVTLYTFRLGKLDSLKTTAGALAEALAFPTQVPEVNAPIIRATLRTYGGVAGEGADVVVGRQRQEFFLASLVARADSARSARDNFRFVLQNDKQFPGVDHKVAASGEAAAAAYAESIRFAAIACSKTSPLTACAPVKCPDGLQCDDKTGHPLYPALPERIRDPGRVREYCILAFGDVPTLVSVRADFGRLQVFGRPDKSEVATEVALTPNEFPTTLDNGSQRWGFTPLWDEQGKAVKYVKTGRYNGINGEAAMGRPEPWSNPYFHARDCGSTTHHIMVQPDGANGWELRVLP